jgi:tetratricopeptide (TPR) repeat protein/tRNA A-37 threonylcarbamoyl transferase component Bud32
MDHAPIDESLRAALLPRFQLLSVLGRGGMATVYLAYESGFDRYVALKVLAEPYHRTIEADRFRREARVLTTLRHPNILRAYDVGSQGVHDWYSMPFVPGESLRERLDRERRLPIDEACQLAIDVLAALTHSHASEIVHRDVKPDNVLLTVQGALLADFGIARRVELADSAVPTVVTAYGVAVGTPAYMSPEQIAAERSIDGRSDVYSTAVMLYECLSGTLPITGRSARDFMARHMTEAPVPLAWVAPNVPTSIVETVQRGLAKAPADRFASAALFRDALIAGLRQSPPDQTSGFGVPAVSVAPLDFSGLPQDRWIALGVAESITNVLRAGKARVLEDRGRRGLTNSRWRVSGTCTVEHARVSITLSIMDGERRVRRALDVIEGHASDFLSLQRTAAQRICVTLGQDGLLSGQLPSREEHSALAEALYLRGRAVATDVDVHTVKTAASYFDRAIQHEPRHVRALEAKADALLQLAARDSAEALREAVACADLALVIDASAPTALFCKAMYHAQRCEWTEAILWMERAVAADPERHDAHYALGRCRLLEALCTPVWEHLGRAVRPLTRAIALDPGHLPSYRDLAAAYLYSGDDEQAHAVLRTADAVARSAPTPPAGVLSGLGALRDVVQRRRDRYDAATTLLHVVLDTDTPDHVLAFPSRACCVLGLDHQRLLESRAMSHHYHAAFRISHSYDFDRRAQ